MRQALLLPCLVLLAACGRTLAEPQPAGPPAPLADVTASWTAGPAGALEGGEVVVGLLQPTPPAQRIVDLVPPEAYVSFLASEAMRTAFPGVDPEPEALEVPEVVEPDWLADLEATEARRRALTAAAARLLEETGVRFRFQEVQADECAGVPLVLAEASLAEAGDREVLRAYVLDGGRLLVSEPGPQEVGEARPGVVPQDPRDVEALVAAGREVLGSSPWIRHLAHDPTRLTLARREGDRVVARFAATPVAASLRDLDDREVDAANVAADGTTTVIAPDPGLDPHAHRLVLTWRTEDLVLRRAYPVADLVGALERRVLASDVTEAGATCAAHVLFRHGPSLLAPEGVAAPGIVVRARLERDGQVLAETQGTSDASGAAPIALPVPADLAAGPLLLRVGDEEILLHVQTGLRLHVTTDRPLYRPTDEIRTRVMAHHATTGAPSAGQEVELRLGDVRQRVTTSAQGIASATFHLVEARPGPMRLQATADAATAEASLLVRAFETPTFLVELEPDHLEVRPGETAPVVVVARYVNGTPVVGARVRGGAEAGLVARDVEGLTDAEGRHEATVEVRADADDGPFRVEVEDADGRRVARVLPVTVLRDEARPRLALVALDDPVARAPGRVALRAAVPGLYRVTLPGAAEPREVLVGPEGVSAPIEIVPGTDRLEVRVAGPDGPEVTLSLAGTAWDGRQPLLRPDRRVGVVGETLALAVLGGDGPVHLDAARGGLLLRTWSVEVQHGHARVEVPLAADLAGVLELRAWRPAPDGGRGAVGSRVRVLVVRGRALDVRASTLAEAYRPGETAGVDVTVRDAAGRPTAAVLGYWGVDAALLRLRPWAGPTEEVFDALPDAPGATTVELALGATRHRPSPPTAARSALGAVEPASWTGDLARVDVSTAPARVEGARAHAREAATLALEAARTAWIAAFAEVPLDRIRTATGLRDQTRFLVDGAWLDGAALQDPWGTPWSLDHAPRAVREGDPPGTRGSWSWVARWGVPCRSAGPDLRFETGDDLVLVWRPYEIEEVPGRIGRFLGFVRRVFERLGGTGPDGALAAPFLGPAFNGLIGIGGGAGGAFGGRGGHRDLGGAGGGRTIPAEPTVHVRRDFDPTLCFVPEAIVGDDGHLRLSIPLKDSITTWRLRLVASAADGATGVGEGAIRVTQPLHAEPWIAPHLTVGDEIDLPVALRNETDVPFDVTVLVTLPPELAAVGPREATAHVDAGGTAAPTFRIRAVAPGAARLRLDATGGGHRDAIERIVTVHRHARAEITAVGGGVSADLPFLAALPPTPAGVPAERRVTLYPTPLADTMGGLEGLIACPHG